MSSERVQRTVASLNAGVSIPRLEEQAGIEYTADELTEVLMHLPPLAQRQWGEQLRALIDQRREKESAQRTEAAVQRAQRDSTEALREAKAANRVGKAMLVVALLALIVALVALCK